jgi:hypothetical protein
MNKCMHKWAYAFMRTISLHEPERVHRTTCMYSHPFRTNTFSLSVCSGDVDVDVDGTGIMEAHGGRLWLRSSGIDKGCTVTLEFPMFPSSLLATSRNVNEAPANAGSDINNVGHRSRGGAGLAVFRSVKIHVDDGIMEDA